MLFSIKSKIKEILQEREYSLERPSLTPNKYPLVMSQIEKAYMQNLFESCGGGGVILNLALVAQLFWHFYTRK